ncbi:MAG: hypothetical protein ABI865_11015, partial [Nitrosospira sp.]
RAAVICKLYVNDLAKVAETGNYVVEKCREEKSVWECDILSHGDLPHPGDERPRKCRYLVIC